MVTISRSQPSELLIATAVFLGGLSWLAIDHYQPWALFYNDFAAFLAIWMLVAHLALTEPQLQYRLPHWVLGILGVALIPLIQAATGVVYFVGDAWIASAYLAGLAAAYSVGFLLSAQDKTLLARGMAWLFLTAALLSTAMALYQWLDLDGLGLLVVNRVRGAAPYANLGMANCLATLLCLGLAAVAYLRLYNAISGPGAVFIALVVIFGLAITQSRTPWLGAGFLCLWWAMKRRSLPGLSGRVLVLLVAFYAALAFIWPQVTQTATEIQLPGQKTADPGERLLIWTQYLDAAWQAPWWGYGWNQVNLAKITAAGIYSETPLESHSHNLLLDLLIWNGLIIGAAIIVCLGAWFTTKLRRCQSRESWFGLLAIGFVLIHSMLEFPHEFAYFLLPVGLLAGMVDADQGVPARLRVRRPAMVSLLAVSGLFMGLVWYEYRIVEDDYRLMRFEIHRIGPLKASQPAPDIYLLSQLREDLRMARSLARENMSSEELEWMRKITYRYPNFSNLFRYALALALNGRREEAGVEFKRLYSLYGEEGYQKAGEAIGQLAATQYPSLRGWQLP